MKAVSVIQYPPMKKTDLVALEDVLAIDIIYGQAFHRKWCRLTSTMRSPGHDRELCFGLLFSLGIIENTRDILALEHCARSRLEGRGYQTITVHLAYELDYQPLDFLSGHPRYSGCGVCGSRDVPMPQAVEKTAADISIDASVLLALPAEIACHQQIFSQTGGCHAAALFDVDGALYALFEDVGRHNALDKLIGHTLLASYNAQTSILVLTSRASFEIVQKAHRAGIFLVVAMGAVSSLAVDLAAENGITLVGFLRAGRFSVYTHPHRIHGICIEAL